MPLQMFVDGFVAIKRYYWLPKREVGPAAIFIQGVVIVRSPNISFAEVGLCRFRAC